MRCSFRREGLVYRGFLARSSENNTGVVCSDLRNQTPELIDNMWRHPKEYRREGIERILLESQLWNFEDLLLNDGCTSIAVLHAQEPFEVQLDEHKLLITYGPTLDGFETILSEQGVRQKDNLRVISQGDHMHTSTSRYTSQFEDLVSHLHADL